MTARVITGDCRATMQSLEADSVDAIVSDPPYGLSFMGKGWDHTVPGVEFWLEAFRVAKPGAHLVAFGGTRTFHRLAVAIEDAGWEIRDCLSWLYGSGFPKSLDVSKAIDSLDAPEATFADALTFTKWLRSTGVTRQQIREATGTFMDSHYLTAGSQPAVPTPEHWALIRPLIAVEIPEWVDRMVGEPGRASENLARREVVGTRVGKDAREGDLYRPGVGVSISKEYSVTRPHTEAAQQWEGWGTALKPGWEPIILARKPLAGTVARNVLAHGTGALNIDGCRIATTEDLNGGAYSGGEARTQSPSMNKGWGAATDGREFVQPEGRWPANVVLDEEAAAQLDAQAPDVGGAAPASGPTLRGETSATPAFGARLGFDGAPAFHGDRGGASRFFYTAKAARAERNAGLDHIPGQSGGSLNMRSDAHAHRTGNASAPRANHHPTVKPLDLMQWLCRLVTPPGGVILDPFCGSGTTGCAATIEGFEFIGCELSAEYAEIARSRIEFWTRRTAGKRKLLDDAGFTHVPVTIPEVSAAPPPSGPTLFDFPAEDPAA